MNQFLTPILLLSLFVTQCFAGGLPDQQLPTQAVKAQVVKLAASRKTATIMMKNGRHLSGRVVNTTDIGFSLAEKSGATQMVAFEDIAWVKRKGHPGVKTLIVVGAVVGTIVVIGLLNYPRT